MAAVKRTERLNSLLKQVLSDVIRKEVHNPNLPEFVTVTEVDITKDLHHAKVYVSVIGTEETKKRAIAVLESAAGFIASRASKQVVIRYFPDLTFYIDESVEKQSRIEELLGKIKEEEKKHSHE